MISLQVGEGGGRKRKGKGKKKKKVWGLVWSLPMSGVGCVRVREKAFVRKDKSGENGENGKNGN